MGKTTEGTPRPPLKATAQSLEPKERKRGQQLHAKEARKCSPPSICLLEKNLGRQSSGEKIMLGKPVYMKTTILNFAFKQVVLDLIDFQGSCKLK